MIFYRTLWDLEKVNPRIFSYSPSPLYIMSLFLLAVNNVRHLYTEWEEFPAELIIRNKSKVTFLSASDSEKMSAQSHEKNDIVSEATTSCSCSPGMQRMSTSRVDKKAGKRGEGKTVTSSKNTRESLSLPLSTTSPACSHPPSHFSRFGKNHHKESEEKTGKDVHREKYSPEELKVIQDRVKSSLENQGVFLYDPVTGAGRTIDLGRSFTCSVIKEPRKAEFPVNQMYTCFTYF